MLFSVNYDFIARKWKKRKKGTRCLELVGDGRRDPAGGFVVF